MTSQTEQQVRPAQAQQQPFPQGSSVDLPLLMSQGVSSTTPGTVQQIQELQQSYFQLAEDTIRHARRVSETLTITWAKQEIVHQVSQEVMSQISQQFAQALQQVRQEVRDEARRTFQQGGQGYSGGQQYGGSQSR